MYSLDTPLRAVKGIGPKLQAQFAKSEVLFVRDLLLQLPTRYNDLSKQTTIAAAVAGQSYTIRAKVLQTSKYYRGGKSILRATIVDKTGKLDLLWFNAKHSLQSLIKDQEYFFSGTISDRGGMVHPAFEKVSEDTIHTNRLVPMYTSTLGIQQGRVRRICKHIIDHLDTDKSGDDDMIFATETLPPLNRALKELHFPSETNAVVAARERLTVEELLVLIRQAKENKKSWAKRHDASVIIVTKPIIPKSIPFELTKSQQKASKEILHDLGRTQPMNRLLTGDVGSGKTVVAGIAARQVVLQKRNTCLIAPTRVLAEQHTKTLQALFPDIPITLITGAQKNSNLLQKPQVFVGTHALFSRLEAINPALLIYDEQHRFGVKQRLGEAGIIAHRLTMTATPIPRSLSLALFAYLDHSQIIELPSNRIPTKTWILPEAKRAKLYDWIEHQIAENPHYLVLLVCPFIEQSKDPGLAKIAAAKARFIELRQRFKLKYPVALLHGKQSPKEQNEVLEALRRQKVTMLVCTPIIEVGIDLPQASTLVIESAGQYGLASLHQLRGRVGRAGQQGYCYVFNDSNSPITSKRLKQFVATTDGHKLAELDLDNRGAGNLFGTTQHGFSFLRFASWTNLELLGQARAIEERLPDSWRSKLFFATLPKLTATN
ncbi:MAG: DEAD/DEAH box helicase [Candidatus Pacebacteria bacterium]|nr:DEAD/DEAH box helicase [Candidatus Paceibacterota bacterium]PIR60332.1 MAG: hypothetical protein COU67_02565 [Candidatus Pacebacteria bacterium CG10_big_fil_rev_8_21_14_0_10_44_54]